MDNKPNGNMNNMPNMQPGAQNMPPNIQNGFMGQQPGMQMGQMGPQPMQPGMQMGQMGAQQMMRPPKQPMSPAKKKKIILIVSIVSSLVVVGIVLAIVLPMVLRVDYSSAYSVAKELQPKIYDIYQSYDCENVVYYVDSDYIEMKSYNEYITGCINLFSSGADELVSKLGNTDGVKRSSEIGAQFDKFNNEYMAISAGNVEELEHKLSLWQARHNFVVAAGDLNYSSTDAEFTTAANYLINSGNDSLKAYGEGWLELKIATAAAYRAYDNASWSDYSAYQALRDTYNKKREELDDWIAINKPDINEIAPLDFNDTYKMYTEFGNLYDLIMDTYELNYNFGSEDCYEYLGEVECY